MRFGFPSSIAVFILTLLFNANASAQPSITTTGCGGIVLVKVDPGLNSSRVAGITLHVKENTEMHPSEWLEVPGPPAKTQNGYIFFWNTLRCHNMPYSIRADISVTDSDTPLTAMSQIKLLNLCISGCSPENVIIGDFKFPPCKLTINVEDNNLQEPMDISVRIYNLENLVKPVRVLKLENVKGSRHTIIWDLKDDKGKLVEPEPYTYDVIIKQVNTISFGSKTMNIRDSCTYRSNYLKIQYAVDENGMRFGNWSVESEADQTAKDNKPEDASLFYERYIIIDSGNIEPLKGRMFLYDPVWSKCEFDMSMLYCNQHKSIDCLKINRKGEYHQVVYYPLSSFVVSDTLFNVMEIFDGHAAEYRDHKSRRALNF